MLRIALALSILLTIMPAHATEAGWAQLREGGQVVLIRHANAPGGDDSAGVEDCDERRNLSSRGQQQARRMGVLFAAKAERTAKVLSSRGCRALETARLAFGASLVEEFPPLDPIGETAGEGAAKAEIMKTIREFSGPGNLVMMTHQAKIEELTGFSPREAEAVIVVPEGDGLHVTGRIIFN